MIITPIFNETTGLWEATSPVPNTWLEVRLDSTGNPMVYRLHPNDGYVLHDAVADGFRLDPETDEMIEELRYHAGISGCALSYDFAPFEMQAEGQSVIAYGDREFFTLLIGDVPESSVYSHPVTPPAEVM